MRKMMMAALFSVLSACAVEPADDQGGDDPAAIEEEPMDQTPSPQLVKDIGLKDQIESVSPRSALQCTENSDCEYNVCDQETHTCCMYPF